MQFLDFFNFRVKRKMHSIVSSIPSQVRKPGAYLLSGKYLRSQLMYKAARSFTVPVKQIITPSAVLELIHTTTLLHDDVLDRQMDRRGSSTLNAVLKNRVSILSGDLLISSALGELANSGNAAVSAEFYKKLNEVIDGEIKQDTKVNIRTPMTRSECLEVAEKKTGGLFALSLVIPGIVSGFDKKDLNFLSDAGVFHGLAFQLADDLSDIGFDVRVSAEQFKHWTWPLLIWNQKNKKTFLQFVSGKLDKMPDEIKIYTDEQTRLCLQQQWVKLLKKHKKADAELVQKISKLLSAELKKFLGYSPCS